MRHWDENVSVAMAPSISNYVTDVVIISRLFRAAFLILESYGTKGFFMWCRQGDGCQF
jgi:hypothetical protein